MKPRVRTAGSRAEPASLAQAKRAGRAAREEIGRALPGETALWLVPAAVDRARLRAVIEELAARCDASVFEPHVTVFGGVTAPQAEAMAALARAAREAPALSLSPSRVAHSPALFQSVFLELAEPDPVFSLRRRLGPELGKHPDDAAWPHVSLIYAELPAGKRQDLCRELIRGPLVRTPIRFDALALVAPRSDDANDWLDIEGWRIVGRFPLASG